MVCHLGWIFFQLIHVTKEFNFLGLGCDLFFSSINLFSLCLAVDVLVK